MRGTPFARHGCEAGPWLGQLFPRHRQSAEPDRRQTVNHHGSPGNDRLGSDPSRPGGTVLPARAHEGLPGGNVRGRSTTGTGRGRADRHRGAARLRRRGGERSWTSPCRGPAATRSACVAWAKRERCLHLSRAAGWIEARTTRPRRESTRSVEDLADELVADSSTEWGEPRAAGERRRRAAPTSPGCSSHRGARRPGGGAGVPPTGTAITTHGVQLSVGRRAAAIFLNEGPTRRGWSSVTPTRGPTSTTTSPSSSGAPTSTTSWPPLRPGGPGARAPRRGAAGRAGARERKPGPLEPGRARTTGSSRVKWRPRPDPPPAASCRPATVAVGRARPGITVELALYRCPARHRARPGRPIA